jgi:hypothetical protein
MPDLGKQKTNVPLLADKESPCEAFETQKQKESQEYHTNSGKNSCTGVTKQEGSEEEKLKTEIAIPESLNEWYQRAKKSDWLPWAVAAGFGVLWLRKGNKNQ